METVGLSYFIVKLKKRIFLGRAGCGMGMNRPLKLLYLIMCTKRVLFVCYPAFLGYDIIVVLFFVWLFCKI